MHRPFSLQLAKRKGEKPGNPTAGWNPYGSLCKRPAPADKSGRRVLGADHVPAETPGNGEQDAKAEAPPDPVCSR